MYLEGKHVRGKVALITRNNAFVELMDCQNQACLTGRLPKDEIVPWEITSIEDILEHGDTIEAVVRKKDEHGREIVLSMRERLDQIAQELVAASGESAWVTASEDAARSVDGARSYQTTESPRRKIERVLVVDDEAEQFLNVESTLDDLGIEHVEYCQDFEQGAAKARKESFDLILMDVKGRDNPTARLDAAESILSEKPDALIVLVTADATLMDDERTQRISLNTAGIILKPVTFANLAEAISRLERIGHAGWPGRLRGHAESVPGFGQGISKTSNLRRPLKEVLHGILTDVAQETGSNRAAIFSMDTRISKVELVAAHNVTESDFKPWKERLPKTR